MIEGVTIQVPFLADLVTRVKEHPLVRLYTGATLEDFGGHIGKFHATLRQGDRVTASCEGTFVHLF